MAQGNRTSANSQATEDTLREVDAKLGASLPLPVGAATSANQSTQIADEGTRKVVSISSTQATFDGTEFEVAGLLASTSYRVASMEFFLNDGTGGNTAVLSLGEATGFTPGEFGDRILFSTTVSDGGTNEVEVYVEGVPVTTDANGKLWIAGITTGADDSTLSWRVDLYEDRSA